VPHGKVAAHLFDIPLPDDVSTNVKLIRFFSSGSIRTNPAVYFVSDAIAEARKGFQRLLPCTQSIRELEMRPWF